MFFSESAADSISSSRQVSRKEGEKEEGEFEKKQKGGGEERGIAKKLVAMAQVCEKEKKETGNRGSKEKPSGVEDKIVGIKKTEPDTKKTTGGKKRSEGYLVSAEDAPVYNLEVFVTHFIFLVLKCFILSSIQYKRFMEKKYEENCTSSQISHKTNATFFMVFIHQFWMSQSKT